MREDSTRGREGGLLSTCYVLSASLGSHNKTIPGSTNVAMKKPPKYSKYCLLICTDSQICCHITDFYANNIN